MYVNKSKRVPLLHFSALCEIFRKKMISKISSFFFQKNVLRFLSLRNSAVFKRSFVILQHSFKIFWTEALILALIEPIWI